MPWVLAAFPPGEAAVAVVSAMFHFNPQYGVYLIGFNDELTSEFKRWIRLQNQGIR